MTFDRGVQKRSVSLSGDVFDPSGTLTGGSRPHTHSILTQLGELCEAEGALKEQATALQALERQLTSVQAEAAKYVMGIRIYSTMCIGETGLGHGLRLEICMYVCMYTCMYVHAV